MKLSLLVNQGKPEAKEIPIRLAQFLIGRDPECQLRPVSALVSKRHCAVLIREGKVFLRDFDSTNGTLVNGEPLKGETELKDGDEFKVGPLSFRVKLSVTSVDTPTPVPPISAAKKPAARAAKPSAASEKQETNSDEDLIADMLLNLEGSPTGGVTSGEDPIPPGSTIMDVAAGLTGSTPPGEGPKPDDAAKKTTKKVTDPAATSNAAKAILDKYMRRPRT
jgi:pSer/pThr/pTyr-binding forkhead associated (FHA) protein